MSNFLSYTFSRHFLIWSTSTSPFFNEMTSKIFTAILTLYIHIYNILNIAFSTMSIFKTFFTNTIFRSPYFMKVMKNKMLPRFCSCPKPHVFIFIIFWTSNFLSYIYSKQIERFHLTNIQKPIFSMKWWLIKFYSDFDFECSYL